MSSVGSAMSSVGSAMSSVGSAMHPGTKGKLLLPVSSCATILSRPP